MLLKLIERGQADFGSNRAGVFIMAAVNIIPLLLTIWSLCVLVISDPGFVTQEVLAQVQANFGLTKEDVSKMSERDLCLELTYRYLFKQGIICTREQLETVEKPEEQGDDDEKEKGGDLTKEQIVKMSISYHYGEIRNKDDLQKLLVYTWCDDCQQLRPPRAHHCSVCNKCIIKMNHHCPMVGSCVGFKNHQKFITFTVHANLGCLYTFLMLTPFAIRQYLDNGLKEKLKAAEMEPNVWLVAVSVVTFLTFFGVLSLMLQQSYYCSANKCSPQIIQLMYYNPFNCSLDAPIDASCSERVFNLNWL